MIRSTLSNRELADFIKSEMLDVIPYRDDNGRELKVSYKDFFTKLRKRKTLAPHLELVSCVTTIDEFYPIIYDCFVKDYGPVNFDIHPKGLKKFSPVLFTLCLDYIRNKGTIISREYTKPGKDIAYLEKLLYSEIHYTRLGSVKDESVYYKNFLAELIKRGEGKDSALGKLIVKAQAILRTPLQKIEVSEDVLHQFYEVCGGIITVPNKIDKTLYPTYREDLRFMFSSVGVYTCVNHIKKVGNIAVLLPVLYTTSSKVKIRYNNPEKNTLIIVVIIAIVLVIFAFAKWYGVNQ